MAQELLTLARPYAKAAFEFALQAQAVPAWSTWLEIAAYAVQDKRVRHLISHPKVSQQALYDFMSEVTQLKGDASLQNFLRLLIAEKRLNLLPQVLQLFQYHRAQQEQVVGVDIETFIAVESNIEQRFADVLTQKLQRQVECQWTENKSLLGGIVIKAPDLDLVIDGSVRGALTQLADDLIA